MISLEINQAIATKNAVKIIILLNTNTNLILLGIKRDN